MSTYREEGLQAQIYALERAAEALPQDSYYRKDLIAAVGNLQTRLAGAAFGSTNFVETGEITDLASGYGSILQQITGSNPLDIEDGIQLDPGALRGVGSADQNKLIDGGILDKVDLFGGDVATTVKEEAAAVADALPTWKSPIVWILLALVAAAVYLKFLRQGG